MSQRLVIVKTPLSRRRVLIATGGVAAVAGGLKVVTWAGRATDAPQRLPARVPDVAVAIPTRGDSRDDYTNRPLLAAIKRAVADVEQAGRDRFRLSVQEVAQPAAPKPPATPMPQILVLAPLMACGAPPDLLAFTSEANPGTVPAELAQATEVRALQPLDDLFKGSTGSTGLALGDYYPAALDVCREQGKLLGVPLMAVPLLLAYDEQRFRRAAVSPPDAGWGWKELLDAARRLTPVAADAAPDQYGLVPYPASASLLALIWQNGGDVLSADKTRALLAEPRAREAIEYFTSFYATQPASPSDAFGGWEWNREGVRVNGRWWAAMTQAPNAGSLVPPMPTAASMLKQTFGEWLDSVREAFGGQAGWQSPMRFAPLPKGRQRASAMLVTATLSVARKSGNPDAAGTALALLAERVSKSVVPSARRLTTDVMKRLAPHYTPDQLQLLADSLADSRALVAGDQSRTKQLHLAVWNSLYLPIQRRTRPLDEIVDSANRAVQAVLSGP